MHTVLLLINTHVMVFLGQRFRYLVQLLSVLWAAELKMKLLQWVQSYSVPFHVQALVGEEMAVRREVVLFLAYWELGLGIPPAAQCGGDVEWLLLLAVENIDVLYLVDREDMYLYMWENANHISISNTAQGCIL